MAGIGHRLAIAVIFANKAVVLREDKLLPNLIVDTQIFYAGKLPWRNCAGYILVYTSTASNQRGPISRRVDHKPFSIQLVQPIHEDPIEKVASVPKAWRISITTPVGRAPLGRRSILHMKPKGLFISVLALS